VRAKIILCALGLTILVALIPQYYGKAQDDNPGPCFLFPEGTSWKKLDRYHNGCEGKPFGCGVIMGYDYLAAEGVPILAPFDGVVSFVGVDGVGNSVLRYQSEDKVWEYGFLHANITARQFQGYKAGEQLALNDDIGYANNIPHPHVWFRDIRTNTNTKDHDQFWRCLGAKPGPKPPTPTPPGDWFGKVIDWLSWLIETAKNYFGGITPPSEPPVSSDKYTFRISYQKPDNIQYQHNIRAFFAWPSSGYNLQKMVEMDLQNFEGSWHIAPGETSVNNFFGTEDYEDGQGMVKPPGFGIGDGACHTASMVAYVLSSEGLIVVCDDPTHKSKIDGVPQKWNCTVCIPTSKYPCSSNKDIHVKSDHSGEVVLHWKIEGDEIQMWVTKSTGDPPQLPFSARWVGIGLAILFVGLIFWYFVLRRPEKVGQSLLFIAKNLPTIKLLFIIAWQESKKLTLLILILMVILTPQLLDLAKHGLTEWRKGTSTLQNWQILALFVAIFVYIIVNVFFKSKILPVVVVGESDSKSHNWIWSIFWIGLGIFYVISPIGLTIPYVDDILVVLVTLFIALPRSWKRKINFTCLIVVIVVIAIVLYPVVSGIIEFVDAINQIRDYVEEFEDNNFVQWILGIFGRDDSIKNEPCGLPPGIPCKPRPVKKKAPIFGAEKIQIKVSRYWPPLGGTNCSSWNGEICTSKMASNERWEYYVDRAVACPDELPFWTKVYVFDQEWLCLDRGGKIDKINNVYWIDFLSEKTYQPYGSLADAKIVKSGSE